MRYNNAVGAKN